MKDITREWLEDAEYDIRSAEAMYDSGRYFFVVFMCHLAIEKMLKALWIEEKGDLPPKVHNLVYLMKATSVKFPEEYLQRISDINDKNVITRYPDGRKLLAETLTQEGVKLTLVKTKELWEWLKQNRILKN